LRRAEVLGVSVPIAETKLSRLLGLSLLDREHAGTGLLIPRCRRVHTFGMRFALDLIFVDPEQVVVEVFRGVEAGRFVRCAGADAVLELPAV
jgi:uncharacterized protein